MTVEEHGVGWHAITVAKDNEVASDDVPAGDTPTYPIPHHEGSRTGQVAQGFQHAFGSCLLHDRDHDRHGAKAKEQQCLLEITK
ncbi:hypothetical protein J2R96_006328 [Bradyrhizobium elkanii]|nr:hypothetical protein [Bradyrhizobium elkanii]